MSTLRHARAQLFPKLKWQLFCHRYSTVPPAPSPPTTSSVGRIASKLPKSLRPYASRFLNHPVSHLTSFLILHEITAIVPLAGLSWLFHATQWTPPGMPGEWVDAGVRKFGSYVRKKVWESFKGEKGARLLLEVAAAWAVVKALLPLRIGLSLWATPWFARVVVVPFINIFRRIRKQPS